MRQASKRIPDSAEKTVRDIRRATRRHHSAEEKIRIVLEGLRGEDSIAELCRKEGIPWANGAPTSHPLSSTPAGSPPPLGQGSKRARQHHLSGISFYGFEAPEGDHGPVGPACSLVSAVSPATVPSCMVSTTVLGTITIVALCFKPS